VVRYSSRKSSLGDRKRKKETVAAFDEFDVLFLNVVFLPGVPRWLDEWALSMWHRLPKIAHVESALANRMERAVVPDFRSRLLFSVTG